MMKPGFMAPADTLKKKPPHGQPCNRCGLCCVATLCPLGRAVFKRELGPCPALEGAIGSAGCGLVANPMKHAMGVALRAGAAEASASALVLIGSATGCDARVNGEPGDPAFYARLVEWDRTHKAEVRRAKRVWGVK